VELIRMEKTHEKTYFAQVPVVDFGIYMSKDSSASIVISFCFFTVATVT